MDTQDVDRREILRYLGYRDQEADGAATTTVERSMTELWETATFKRLYREYPLSLGEDYRIGGGCFNARSRNLQGNLRDCDQIIMLVAILSCGAGHLTQKYSRLQMSRAMATQAAAAAMIEEYCGQVRTVIKLEYEAKGRYSRPRFSPGYGDFPLERQGILLETLETGERIDIRLADNLLVIPPKSASVVTGISRESYRYDVKGCEAYAKTDCSYRR